MTSNELKFILEEGEGYKLEFKESLDKSLARELVAFANASGGRLFLGVTDDGKAKGKKVVRRNPLFASLLYRAGYVENLGTGILKIRNLLKEGKNKTAEFEATTGFFTIIFKRKKMNVEGISGGLNEGINSKDGGLNGGLNLPSEIQVSKEVKQRLARIIKLIKETEGIQLNEITTKLNIATRTIERDLGFLRKH